MAGFAGILSRVATSQLPGVSFTSAAMPAQNAIRGIVDANFHAKDLMDAFLARLHVARKKFSLLIDLFDDAVKHLFSGKESTRISAFWPSCTRPISVSGM